MRRGWLVLVMTILFPVSAAGQGMDRVRQLYLESVEREGAIAEGLRALESEAPSPLADAYRGALITLRAKHARWPVARVRHLRAGLPLLDGAVRARPDQAEIRFLRLLSCFYLPGVLGRGGSVREDLAALARLLPGAGATFGPLYPAAVRFVVEHGTLTEAQRAALLQALEPGDA